MTTDDAAAFWNDHYRSGGPDVAVRPNPLLVEVATGLRPGHALDLGCGRGGDALWLAEQGWRVTAVDIAESAVAGVIDRARERGVGERVDARQCDLTSDFPAGDFDLVSAQYFHTPFGMSRAEVLRKAAQSLRPGGRLLVADHGSIAPWSWNQDPDTHFPTPAEVAAELALDGAGWRVVRDDVPVRTADGPGGQRAEVTDNVLLVQRAGGA